MTDREKMIEALRSIKAICKKSSCKECPMQDICSVAPTPLNWEVPKK